MDEVFKQGFNSYSLNKGKLINPYPNGTQAFNDYERGWIQAQKRSINFFKNTWNDSSEQSVTKKLALDKKKVDAEAYANRKGY